MSNLRAFNHSVNTVCYIKNGIKYGATIAWGMQVDFDKIMLLMGSQSVTGNNIVEGDIIGVSALSVNQKEIATKLGDGHSDESDKFADICCNIKENAITIDGASREMIVKVKQILKLDGIEEDNLIYGEVVEFKENNDDFLNYINYLG